MTHMPRQETGNCAGFCSCFFVLHVVLDFDLMDFFGEQDWHEEVAGCTAVEENGGGGVGCHSPSRSISRVLHDQDFDSGIPRDLGRGFNIVMFRLTLYL